MADSYIGLDVLSSKMDVKVANFRRLMGLPVYGMAQPARDVSGQTTVNKRAPIHDIISINDMVHRPL